MQFLILGMVALGLGYLGLKAFAGLTPAQRHQLARFPMLAGGGVMVAIGAWLAVRGAFSTALPVVAVGLWLLLGQGQGAFGGLGGSGGGAVPGGATSAVVTDHLEMTLDHGSGEMRGRILKGFFQGRRIETLRPVELAHLWQDCRFVDPKSAQLVEAYLDRVHPTWREDMARAEAEEPKGPDGRMTRAEALEILGLEGEPGADAVRRAHRELMLKLHPDRGGSTYLAAKVNEAKAVLLDGET